MSATNKNDTIFSLTRLKKQCYFPPVSVDFTPISRPNLGNTSILPKFNSDANFFTPTFVNPYQYYRHARCSTQIIEKQREKFLKKIERDNEEPTQKDIKFNPRDDLYCSICRVHFDCYWKHVNSKTHYSKIKSNRSNQYIHELCSSYLKKLKLPKNKKKKQEGSDLKMKTKNISKGITNRPKREKYRKEDFIIIFPKQLLEKELMAGCNSTNGMISLEQKR